MCDVALIVLEELNLCIDDFQEEYFLRLGEERKFWLVRSLRHQLPSIEGNGDAEGWRYLIRTDVLLEYGSRHRDGFPLRRQHDLFPVHDRSQLGRDCFGSAPV